MATFYSKKKIVFGIFLVLANVQNSFGQAQVVQDKKSAGFQKDHAGRPYFIDKDGDKIVILDYKTRKDLQDVAAYKESDQAKIPIDSKSFYKETVTAKIPETPRAVYSMYTVEEGDTWESISLKLYGVADRWPQLKLWNENLLINLKLPAGAQMKYIEK